MSAEGLSLIHDTSTTERHANLHLIDGQRIDGFKVVGQQHEVGQPSRLDTPAIVLAHAEQGGINGVGLDRFPGADALIRSHEAAARGNAVDGGMDGIKRRDRQHRGVHVESEGKANPDGGTGGIEPVGAAGAKIGVVVAVAPHFDMPDKKSGERMAGLHAAENADNGALTIFADEYADSVSLPKMLETGNFWMQLEVLFSKVWNGEDVTTLVQQLADNMSQQLGNTEN